MISKDELLKAKILAIDDEEDNISLLMILLESEGFTNVHTTTDSTKLVEMYKSLRPDILLLDLNMPIVDGFDIMDSLKEFEKDSYCPILVMTANKDEESRIKALNKGAKDFLTKPFGKSEALLRINNMLEVRLLYNKMSDENILLESKVKERTRDMIEAQLEIIQRLGRAVEYRDVATGSHVARVSQISLLIAKKIGLSNELCSLLRDASILHDIGKLGIPDSILLKPGRLDEKEWVIMRKHTIFGADMLSGGKSELLKMAQKIAMNHHEKWDGTGYPQHLSGEKIPLEGRICAIADVFDTITSERLYKRAKSTVEAINEIRKANGTAFDPELVEAFFDVIPDITQLKQ